MSFGRVVAATDFSEASERAVLLAARWAQQFERPLTVLHSYDPAPLGPSAASPLPAWPTKGGAKAIARRAKEQLEGLKDGVLAGIEHETALMDHPRPALGLCDFAEPDDLLVVGTHGRTGVKRMLMGSVAEQTIRHAPCAVLAVRGEFELEAFPKHIMVCTDLSPAALPAVTTAGVVARAFGARATVLTVEHADDWQDATAAADDAQLAQVRGGLENSLRALHETHLPPPVQTQFVVADHRAEGIVEHVQQAGADLIVMATHGRTGLTRLVIGSVTEKVSRTAHCPVLVARSGPEQPDM